MNRDRVNADDASILLNPDRGLNMANNNITDRRLSLIYLFLVPRKLLDYRL